MYYCIASNALYNHADFIYLNTLDLYHDNVTKMLMYLF